MITQKQNNDVMWQNSVALFGVSRAKNIYIHIYQSINDVFVLVKTNDIILVMQPKLSLCVL